MDRKKQQPVYLLFKNHNKDECGSDYNSSFTDPTKFFGCELGAQTQFDVKNDRYIVNGSHEANKLQDMLDGFIKKFVLCPECENPETDLVSALSALTVTRWKHCVRPL